MWCIAPNKTPLSEAKAFSPNAIPFVCFHPLDYSQQTFKHSLFQSIILIITITKVKITTEIIGNNMDLIIWYPKPRDTCIYVEFQARFCLTMQYGNTEMKMPRVALSPKKTKHNHHNDPALKKHLGVEVLREVSLQHCENHPNGWKNVPTTPAGISIQ